MRKLFTLLTTVSLFSTVAAAADSSTDSDAAKIREIMDGKRINCSTYEPGLTPTLNYETVGPRVLLNATATQVSLQMKVVYYRCHKGADGEGTFTVVDPATPYQYDVEQFDGTKSTVKVNSQQYRFSALKGSMGVNDIKAGILARVETEGLVHNLRFDIPLEKLLSQPQRTSLKAGREVAVTIRVISALAMDYRIGTQTQAETDFTPASSMLWDLKLSMPKNTLKAELVKVRSSRL